MHISQGNCLLPLTFWDKQLLLCWTPVNMATSEEFCMKPSLGGVATALLHEKCGKRAIATSDIFLKIYVKY